MPRDSYDSLIARAKGISLGVFAADLGDLRAAAQNATTWGCNIIHFDIMDGVFVPQFTGGAGFVGALQTNAVCDVHLMVESPTEHISAFVDNGADIITVHAEAKGAADALVAIRAAAKTAGRPILAGLGIMPETAPEDIGDLLDLAPDLILVLSLDPRTKAPPNIEEACNKLSALRQKFNNKGPLLAFDGGVTLKTIDQIGQCKPDMIVSGSAVFGASDPRKAFNAMNKVL